MTESKKQIYWHLLNNAIVNKLTQVCNCIHIWKSYVRMIEDWTHLIPVNLLEPLVYTCSMKFMMARQNPQAISLLIFHKAYITSTRSSKTEGNLRQSSIMRYNCNRISNHSKLYWTKKKRTNLLITSYSQKCTSNRKRKGKKPHVAVRGNKGQQLLIITNKKDNPNKTKKKKIFQTIYIKIKVTNVTQ